MNNVKLARTFLWALILTSVCSRGLANFEDYVTAPIKEAVPVVVEAVKPSRFASVWGSVKGLGSTVANSTVAQKSLTGLSTAGNYGWNTLSATGSTLKNAGSATWGVVTTPKESATIAYNASVNGLKATGSALKNVGSTVANSTVAQKSLAGLSTAGNYGWNTLSATGSTLKNAGSTAADAVMHPVATAQLAYEVSRRNPKLSIGVPVTAAVLVTAYLYRDAIRDAMPSMATVKANIPSLPAMPSLHAKISDEVKAQAIQAMTNSVNSGDVGTFVALLSTNPQLATTAEELNIEVERLNKLSTKARGEVLTKKGQISEVIKNFTAKIKAL